MTNDFTAVWKNKMADKWAMYTSPSRPNISEIEIYREFLKKAVDDERSPKILIFGATPELRDLAAEIKEAQVVLVDINIEMIQAMTLLMKTKNPAEVWIRSDWLKAPLPDNFFDAALGDYTDDNLPFELQEIYFHKINQALRKDKFFIGREFFYRNGMQSLSLDELLQKFEGQKIDNETISGFWDAGVFLIADEKEELKTHAAKVADFCERVNKYSVGNGKHKNQKWVRELLGKSYEWYPAEKIWFISGEKDYKSRVERYFDIIAEKTSPDVNIPDPYKAISPIILFKKK